MVLPRRSIRRRPGPLPSVGRPRLLDSDPAAGPAGRTGWTLAMRAHMLRLSPVMVEADLAELGVVVSRLRLRQVMAGVEPVDPALLTGLVTVLFLHDRSLSDDRVTAAAAGPWLAVGHRVPPKVVQILADVRGLSTQQVLDLAARTRRTG